MVLYMQTNNDFEFIVSVPAAGFEDSQIVEILSAV